MASHCGQCKCQLVGTRTFKFFAREVGMRVDTHQLITVCTDVRIGQRSKSVSSSSLASVNSLVGTADTS